MLTKNEEFVFFWSGVFSQWHKSVFFVNGVKYTSAEQFMMAGKAKLFGDTATWQKIMATDDPRTIKKLGREVVGYDDAIWVENRFHIVLTGSIAKFKQNPDLLVELMDTGTKTLVEASPKDNIWGIGMAEDHPDVGDVTKWQGLNLLGQALTCAREVIKAERFSVT